MDPHARGGLSSAASGCLLQAALFSLAGVLMVGGVLVGRFAPLPRGVDRQMVVLASTVGGCMLALLVTVVAAVVIIRRRNARLDEAFRAVGCTSSAVGLVGRHFTAQAAGRRLDGYFSKGPQIEIYLSSSCSTRLAVGAQTAVGGVIRAVAGVQPLQLADPAYQGLVATAAEPWWGQGALSQPPVREAITRLARASGGYNVVLVQPGSVALFCRYLSLDEVTGERVSAWVRDLGALASAIEALPPPQHPQQESAMQQRLRTGRGGAVLVIVVVVVGALMLLSVLATVLVMMLTRR